MDYRKEIKIDYPEAENQELTHAAHNLEIWIDVDGVIDYRGEIIDPVTLENIIVDKLVNVPETRMHVVADKHTKYKDINNVLEILKLLQHRVVSLVIKNETGTDNNMAEPQSTQ